MKPADLQPGDVCRYDDGRIAYRVESIIAADTTKVEARIRWEQDGGLDARAWDKPDEDIPALGKPTRAQS
jgi:hypothetical protein